MRSFVAPASSQPRRERHSPPSFSIVIPAYQAAATIAETLESALAQTRPAHEVIVSDDGSTDDLAGALAPYLDRITVLPGPHEGASAAKNRGVRAASGEFLVVLDADDVFLPERLEALGDLALARPELDLLATDAYIESGGRVVGRWYGERPFPADDQRQAILRRCFLLQHTAVLREVLLEIGGFDAAAEPAEDWDAWIRLILAGSRAGLVDEPLAGYRIRSGSFTSARPRALRGRVVALQKAASDPTLSGSERAAARQTLVAERRAAVLAEAEAALRARAPDARRRAFAVVRDAAGVATRLKGAAAFVAPRAAARALERRERRTGASRLRRTLDASATGDTRERPAAPR